MGIGAQALAIDFLAEVIQLFFGQEPEQIGACVYAGRRMALEEHQIAAVLGGRCMPEMVVADFVEGGGARIAGDVAAELTVLAIGLDHHRHRVPAIDGADLPFQFRITGRVLLAVRRNGVDVGGLGRVGQVDTGASRLVDQTFEQIMTAFDALYFNHRIEGVEPLLGFLRVVVR